MQYVYRIDQDSIIIDLSSSWVDFARQNWDPEFESKSILGTSLWDHITDLPTRRIYNHIISRLRADQGSIIFEFRCDSPAMRRFMQMEMTALPLGEMEFRVRTINEEPRDPIVLAERQAIAGGHMLTMCSWCKRVVTPDWAVPFGPGLVEGAWEELEFLMTPLSLADAGRLPGVCHGSCPECRLRILQVMDRAV